MACMRTHLVYNSNYSTALFTIVVLYDLSLISDCQLTISQTLLTPGNYLPEKDVPKDAAQLSLQAAPSPKLSDCRSVAVW